MAFGNGYGLGLQFQPGVPQNGEGNGTMTRGRVQEPVQILSTRLPKFFGTQSIAPQALLQGGGGMGMAGAHGNVVAHALAQLAGLPPGMLPSATSATPLDRSGTSMGAGPGWGLSPLPMGPAGNPPAPPPMPPLYNPPPPRVIPGGQRPNPIPRPVPGPDNQPGIKEEVSPGGYGDWIRRERDLNGPGNDELVRILMDELSRSR